MYKLPKKKQLGQEAIPTTSLADMMFLLLIFFIMTTTLSRVTGFVTDMPSGSKSAQPQQEKAPTVTLHGDNIALNDQNVSLPDLRAKLRAMRLDQKSGDDKVVIVTTEGDVTYQNYFETLALIQACGGMVAIVSEEEGGKKAP
jgi:biopolymer transport protein ExbD